jgi:Flp pilus assembly pilin Flp
MLSKISDRCLWGQVVLLQLPSRIRRRTNATVEKLASDRGQTPTEYLMIVGFMATVIVAVFVYAYWDNVKTVAGEWVGNVKGAVSGTDKTGADIRGTVKTP